MSLWFCFHGALYAAEDGHFEFVESLKIETGKRALCLIAHEYCADEEGLEHILLPTSLKQPKVFTKFLRSATRKTPKNTIVNFDWQSFKIFLDYLLCSPAGFQAIRIWLDNQQIAIPQTLEALKAIPQLARQSDICILPKTIEFWEPLRHANYVDNIECAFPFRERCTFLPPEIWDLMSDIKLAGPCFAALYFGTQMLAGWIDLKLSSANAQENLFRILHEAGYLIFKREKFYDAVSTNANYSPIVIRTYKSKAYLCDKVIASANGFAIACPAYFEWTHKTRNCTVRNFCCGKPTLLEFEPHSIQAWKASNFIYLPPMDVEACRTYAKQVIRYTLVDKTQ